MSVACNILRRLGFDINSMDMTVSIPNKKLSEVLHESLINKQRLQLLVGKLVYLANAISHARKFTGRLLSTL